MNKEKRRQFDAIIEEENLKREKAVEFIENAYERGYVPEGGMELDGIMPAINPFDVNANREGKIANVLEKLKAFFSDKGININVTIENHYHGNIDNVVNIEQEKK